MSILGWVTDRIILEPTRHEIPVPDVGRELLPYANGHLEVWVHRFGPCTEGGSAREPEFYVLKFPGTASRAENSVALVENCWPESCIEVWAVNPPGYGGSTGQASLGNITAMASRALEELKEVAKDKPVLVAGGSLGSVSALYLAANYPVDGVVVQNPPALREVIQAHDRWRHFSWATRVVARQVPEVLDSIKNARNVRVPGIFSVAGKDRIVPAPYQQQIIDAYAGPKRVGFRPEADHDTPLSGDDLQELRLLATWLRQGLVRPLAQ